MTRRQEIRISVDGCLYLGLNLLSTTCYQLYIKYLVTRFASLASNAQNYISSLLSLPLVLLVKVSLDASPWDFVNRLFLCDHWTKGTSKGNSPKEFCCSLAFWL